MLKKISEFLNSLSKNDGAPLPEIYLDFSSEEKQYALVALRLRNLTQSPISVTKLEFVSRKLPDPLDVSECVIGSRVTLDGPFPYNGPGTINVKGVKLREMLSKLGYKGVLRGKIIAHLGGTSHAPVVSPEFDIDFDAETVRYQHAGRGKKRY